MGLPFGHFLSSTSLLGSSFSDPIHILTCRSLTPFPQGFALESTTVVALGFPSRKESALN